MFATKRVRIVAAALAVALASGGIAAAVATNAWASPTSAQVSNSAAMANGPKLSAARFDLNGYQIDAQYTLGRNTGNTFRQTYTHSMVLRTAHFPPPSERSVTRGGSAGGMS